MALHLTVASDAWVGIGFSVDQSMGDDDIYYCQNRNNRVGVVSAFSTGMSRPVNVDGTLDVSNVGTSRTDNNFQCSFRRQISVTKGGIDKRI